ncbi:LysE family translocator [Hydrogenophaga sp. 5NK40-0174]|uniref:LysE family translocator n=1 Tax=Hydrogenophaga sp. 5NK40-0174 TaxID=3127649 RepID=UPI003107F9DB
MNPSELIALLMLATAISFTPGPNTALSAAMGANRGWRSAMRFVISVPVGWGLLFSLCAAGLGAAVVGIPWMRAGVQWGGSAYLVWLAWRLWQARQMGGAEAGSTLNVGFWQGVSLQFVNIKAWMMALTVVGGWVAGHDNAGLRFVQVFPLMLAFAFASNMTYASLGSVLRHWLAGPVLDGQASWRRLMWFNRTMACLLVLTAFYMTSVSIPLSRAGVTP